MVKGVESLGSGDRLEPNPCFIMYQKTKVRQRGKSDLLSMK